MAKDKSQDKKDDEKQHEDQGQKEEHKDTNQGQGQKDKNNDQGNKKDKDNKDKGEGGNNGRSKSRSKSAKSRKGASRSAKSRRSDGSETARSEGKKKQKDYFKEELRRLEDNLQEEASKIKQPEKKEHSPYIFNTLEPYYNTDTPRFLIELPEQQRHGYVSRQTATGLCDPWVDHTMDVELLPKIDSKTAPSDDNDKKKKKDSPRDKEGSTRLPKFPAVSIPTDDLTKNKTLYYSDVPQIREELKKKCGTTSDSRVDAEYNRTKQDFYRMELDKMEEYHPSSRPKMKATYLAYLTNNPGSRKAVHECVKEVEKKEQDEKNQKEKEKTKKGKGEKSRGEDSRRQSHDSRQSQTAA